ncbi:beta-sandwich domain-containing protein [Bdellovibrio svalbardensis]|uniref:Beta-sandwich domain-containing protein n=1 Tax=Bdellovibrio svalbardensis TaxID=2972972 RepID=A0ABT6DGF0_9BACT|nr:beta-sandwich domain-containing protein [Bdellovibrio svalbardensis]MDG0815933.1 beta-sandwich domain-containing protein [Bdellovibrio svalbardensis]
MKRYLIASVLASLTMMQMPAHAEMLDLPDPGLSAVPSLPVSQPQAPVSQPQAAVQSETVQRERMGSVVVNSMTRQSGGEIYRIDLSPSLNLSRVEVKVLKSRLKISKAEAVMASGQRILLRELMAGAAAETGTTLVSESINAEIKALEITGESYSAEADIRVTGVSMVGQPVLTLKRAPVVVKPANPPVQDSCQVGRSDEALLKTHLDQIALWGGRAQAALAGSAVQSFAINEMDRSVQNVVSIVESQNLKASAEYLQQLMDFYTQKFAEAAAGSKVEARYKTLRRAFAGAFESASNMAMDCKIRNMRGTSEELITQTQVYYEKYTKTPNGSVEETLYRRLARAAADRVLPAYDAELARNNSFRKLEKEYQFNYSRYTKVPTGSILESTYRAMARKAIDRALVVLANEVRSMDAEQKYRLLEEYQGKYQATEVGSIHESFAKSVLRTVGN